MSTAPLPFDILRAIIELSPRDGLRAWSLVSWDCFTVAGRRLSSSVEVKNKDELYTGFWTRMAVDASHPSPLLPRIASVVSLPKYLTNLTLHLTHPTIPFPTQPSALLSTPHPLQTLTIHLSPLHPAIGTSPASALALFAPQSLLILPPLQGAHGLFTFCIKPAARAVFSLWSSTGTTERVVMRGCDLLTCTDPGVQGRATFPAEAEEMAKEGRVMVREAEIVWDTRGVDFGGNFFEFLVKMLEGEGSVSENGRRRKIVVEDEERKRWVIKGMQSKSLEGIVDVEVKGEEEEEV